MQVISPSDKSDMEAYYQLRWEVLRKPWGQKKGSEHVDDDKDAIHALLKDSKGNAVAVGRMHLLPGKRAQVRFVAVDPSHQGKGFGKMIMHFLEEKAIQLEINEIMLEAREPSLVFYQKLGYSLVKKSYLLFDEIQHYTMVKAL